MQRSLVPLASITLNRIDILKITVRQVRQRDIDDRNLPQNTKGLLITEIEKDSPINYLEKGNIIIEAQKRKIRTVGDLEISINTAIKSNEKTLLIVIYDNQNQKRYIGVKLD